MAESFSVPHFHFKWKWIHIFATVVVLGISLRSLSSHLPVKLARINGARLSSEQASLRIAFLCSRIEGECEQVAPPAFLDKRRFSERYRVPHASAWLGMAHVSGRTIHLQINDATGNLVYFHDVADYPRELRNPADGAPVESAVQAAQISLEWLRALDIASPKDRIALASAPVSRPLIGDWLIIWRIASGAGSAPTTIKMNVSASDGHLLEAFNVRERYESVQR